jgi:hypothetical protein
MERPRPKRVDALRLLVKTSLAERQRRSPWRLLLLAALGLGLLGLFAWYIYPRPKLPRLRVAAFDQVARPDVPVPISARLGSIEDEETTADLSGCELFFDGGPTGFADQAAADRAGRATVTGSFAAQKGPVEYVVRFPGHGDQKRGAEDRGRIYVWPEDAALLVVDADHALAQAEEEQFWSRPNLDIRPRPEAAAALRQLHEKYHLVYLTGNADRPYRYAKLRHWLTLAALPRREVFPDGPVLDFAGELARAHASAFGRQVLGDLKSRFHGLAVAIAGREEEARLFHEAGWRTFLVEETGAVPEGITVVKSWKDLARQLTK